MEWYIKIAVEFKVVILRHAYRARCVIVNLVGMPEG